MYVTEMLFEVLGGLRSEQKEREWRGQPVLTKAEIDARLTKRAMEIYAHTGYRYELRELLNLWDLYHAATRAKETAW